MSLANETWSTILAHLSLNDLTAASLVSKTWQALAFSHLYRTVSLTLCRHLEDLALRAASDKDGPLSICTHVRGLVFDDGYRKLTGDTSERIVKEDLEHLMSILPKLTRLEYFSWDTMGIYPRNPEVINALQTCCPNLKSVQWSMEDLDYSYDDDDDFDRSFILPMFTNLSHFSVTTDRLLPAESSEGYVKPLSDILLASPDLKSLTLNLCDYDWSQTCWSPDQVLSTLGSHTFSSLRVFRAAGHPNPNWDHFFSSSDCSPFRAFLSRHPTLHTIGIGWTREHNYYERIDPGVMSTLLPSLKHLEAPTLFCGAVLASTLASGLASIDVLDEAPDSDGPNFSTITRALSPLPNLRKLTLHQLEDKIDVVALKELLRVAPGLEELTFLISLDKPDQILSLLSLVPNLRTLGAPPQALSKIISQGDIETSEWQKWLPELARACPSLKCVNNPYPWGNRENWTINRERDGRLDIALVSSRQKV